MRSNSSNLRAVLWDFGGVLTTSPFDNFARFERDHGLPVDFLRRVNAANPDNNAWARFERSEIGLEAFDRLFEEETRAAGHPVPGASVIALLAVELRPAMVEALRFVARRLPTACITNNVNSGAAPGPGVAEVMALFEVVVESSQVGVRKPDRRIYRMACEALGVEPAAAAYLDDLGVNLKPARAMGMTTIKVADPDAAIAELEAALGFPLR